MAQVMSSSGKPNPTRPDQVETVDPPVQRVETSLDGLPWSPEYLAGQGSDPRPHSP
jgi:hypothetical protein